MYRGSSAHAHSNRRCIGLTCTGCSMHAFAHLNGKCSCSIKELIRGSIPHLVYPARQKVIWWRITARKSGTNFGYTTPSKTFKYTIICATFLLPPRGSPLELTSPKEQGSLISEAVLQSYKGPRRARTLVHRTCTWRNE